MRIILSQLNPVVGDLQGNTHCIIEEIQKGKREKADLIVFPELVLTGYPPHDLLLLPHFLEETKHFLELIVKEVQGLTVIIGFPRHAVSGEKFLHNSAAIITDGVVQGYHDKVLLPTYDVFDERRYFEPGGEIKLWSVQGKKIGVTICEDIWQHGEELRYTSYKQDPILKLKELKPDFVVNLSSSPYSLQKKERRIAVCEKVAKTLNCPVFLCNQVGGNDSLIFDGHSVVVDQEGVLCSLGKGFKEDCILVNTPPVRATFHVDEPLEELHQALVLGLRDYFYKQGFKKACIGLSGGVDSSLVACLAVDALGKENVLGVIMPSRYNPSSSLEDAEELAKNLGIDWEIISIESPFKSYLDLFKPIFKEKEEDVTEENIQSRIRGMILMALSNKFSYLALSTGNKSEIALGYATLYGDMCGGLAVIGDLTKEQVYALSNHLKGLIPSRVLTKAPSAELRPNQKDSDSLPDYSIIDHVIQEYIVEHLAPEEIAEKHGYPFSVVSELIEKIHRNEYKRRQGPPCLRISEKAFSIGRNFPIVNRYGSQNFF